MPFFNFIFALIQILKHFFVTILYLLNSLIARGINISEKISTKLRKATKNLNKGKKNQKDYYMPKLTFTPMVWALCGHTSSGSTVFL